MRVDLKPAAAVQQDSGVAHDGAALVVLVLHGRHAGQEVVEPLRYVCGSVAIEDIVDDVPRLERALQDGDVPLRVQKPENVLSAKKR